MPRSSGKLWRTFWKAMEVVKRRSRITINTFHKTSTRTMTWLSPPPLGIRATAYHTDSSISQPSRKAACNNATTFCQWYRAGGSIYVVYIVFLISVYILSVYTSLPISVPDPIDPASSALVAAAASSYSAFQALHSHFQRCSALTPEGFPERLELSLHTAYSI